MNFNDRLKAELIALDMREARGRFHNPYAIAHYLRAAEEAMAYIAEGRTLEWAFAKCFNPTRGMHTIARHLGLQLDVVRGKWIRWEGTNESQ